MLNLCDSKYPQTTSINTIMYYDVYYVANLASLNLTVIRSRDGFDVYSVNTTELYASNIYRFSCCSAIFCVIVK